MKFVFFLIGIIIFNDANASEAPPTFSNLFMTFKSLDETAVIETIDSALKPLGYERKSDGTRYPMANVQKGMFAFYTATGPSAILIVSVHDTSCYSFGASSYAANGKTQLSNARTAFITALTKRFKSDISFFTDDICKTALSL